MKSFIFLTIALATAVSSAQPQKGFEEKGLDPKSAQYKALDAKRVLALETFDILEKIKDIETVRSARYAAERAKPSVPASKDPLKDLSFMMMENFRKEMERTDENQMIADLRADACMKIGKLSTMAKTDPNAIKAEKYCLNERALRISTVDARDAVGTISHRAFLAMRGYTVEEEPTTKPKPVTSTKTATAAN